MSPARGSRKSYDALKQALRREADLEYLRILDLAASTLEMELETALELLLDAGESICLREPTDELFSQWVRNLTSGARGLICYVSELRGYDFCALQAPRDSVGKLGKIRMR